MPDTGISWIAIGDIHDDMGNFSKIPELAEAAGVLVTGDLTLTGGAKQAEKILNAIRATGLPILAQIGNMDRPEVNDWLTEAGINLHCHVRELAPETVIFGIGGSTFTPFGTPSEFPESAFAGWLDEMWPRARQYRNKILISHNPPKDTLCDAISSDIHVGSAAVREFIEENQPDICICGHIHEAKSLDRIGRTIVLNPGQINQGGYALIRLEDGKLFAELKQIEVS